jgi:hypothetical protein
MIVDQRERGRGFCSVAICIRKNGADEWATMVVPAIIGAIQMIVVPYEGVTNDHWSNPNDRGTVRGSHQRSLEQSK